MQAVVTRVPLGPRALALLVRLHDVIVLKIRTVFWKAAYACLAPPQAARCSPTIKHNAQRLAIVNGFPRRTATRTVKETACPTAAAEAVVVVVRVMERPRIVQSAGKPARLCVVVNVGVQRSDVRRTGG